MQSAVTFLPEHVVIPSVLPEERRRHRRIPVEGIGFVRQINPAEHRRPSQVRLIDASQMGIGLAMDRAVTIGTMLQVRMNDLLVMGEVRHCTARGDEFVLGIQVDEMMRAGSEAAC